MVEPFFVGFRFMSALNNPLDIFFPVVAVSWIGSVFIIKTDGVYLLFFLGISVFFSGVTLAKLDPNPVKI